MGRVDYILLACLKTTFGGPEPCWQPSVRRLHAEYDRRDADKSCGTSWSGDIFPDRHLRPRGRNDASTQFCSRLPGCGTGGYEAFPDICRLRDGRLMCVFYAGYGHVALPNDSLPRGGRICYCLSSDEGRTWTEARILYDGPDDDRDPSIVQLANGQVICNFFSLRKDTARKPYTGLGSWIVTSADLGATWSEPIQISASYYCSARSANSPRAGWSSGCMRKPTKAGRTER